VKERDARQLKIGDTILFGPLEREGKVAFVTPSGAAVKVHPTDGGSAELVLSAHLRRRRARHMR
jgi:hypothetical protein